MLLPEFQLDLSIIPLSKSESITYPIAPGLGEIATFGVSVGGDITGL